MTAPAEQVAAMRTEIDEIDTSIADLVTRRADVVARLVALKRVHALPLQDPGREAEIVCRYVAAAARRRVDPVKIATLAAEVLRACRCF